MSKRLGGMNSWKYKTSSWHLNGFPDGNNIGIVSGRNFILFFNNVKIFADLAVAVLYAAHPAILPVL